MGNATDSSVDRGVILHDLDLQQSKPDEAVDCVTSQLSTTTVPTTLEQSWH